MASPKERALVGKCVVRGEGEERLGAARAFASILLQKNGQFFQHFTYHARRSLRCETRLSRPPVEALHLIGEHDARNGSIGW